MWPLVRTALLYLVLRQSSLSCKIYGSTALSSSRGQPSASLKAESSIPQELASWCKAKNYKYKMEPLDGPGYCNKLFRILPNVGILKVYSELARERRKLSGLTFIDEQLGEIGVGPRVLHSSSSGLVMNALPPPPLTEQDVHAEGASDTLLSVSTTLALLHSTQPESKTEVRVNTKNMLWSALEILLSRIKNEDCRRYYKEQVEWQRDNLDALNLPMVALGHGDFKPSNVMMNGEDAKLIDFEMVGCHYRAFDLAKFFRTKSPTPWTVDNRRLFYDHYLSCLGDRSTTLSKLELESQLLIPMTWLEAAMFFEATEEYTMAADRKNSYEASRQLFIENISRYKRTS